MYLLKCKSNNTVKIILLSEKAESPTEEMIEIGSQESVIILDDEDDGEPAQKRQKTTEEMMINTLKSHH
jgi:hypothetical protein